MNERQRQGRGEGKKGDEEVQGQEGREDRNQDQGVVRDDVIDDAVGNLEKAERVVEKVRERALNRSGRDELGERGPGCVNVKTVKRARRYDGLFVVSLGCKQQKRQAICRYATLRQ